MNCLHAKGYVRYSDKTSGFVLEHRMVARIAWGPRVKFPANAHIHHQDGIRTHNCRENLVILDPRLHDARMHKGKGR